MNSIILEKPGQLIYADTTLNKNLQSDEALLKVHNIGICGTDYHAYQGNQPFFSYPRILGHELGVEVIQVGGKVTNVQVGDRCAIEPYQNNQQDQAVRRGFTNCGEQVSVFGVHEDGGMREYIKIRAKYLHKSVQLNYDQLALIEPLSIGCHAVNRAQVQQEDYVMVIGAGPIGLATLQFASLTGAKTIAMDINEDRLTFAKSMLPLAGSVVAGREDTLEQIRALFNGDLPTVVLDATGNRHSMANTLEYTAPAGKIVFIGLFQGDFSFHDPYFHKKELTLMASRNSLSSDFTQIIKMMEDGKINTDAWITHRSSFDNMIAQFDEWLKPESKVIKAMVSL